MIINRKKSQKRLVEVRARGSILKIVADQTSNDKKNSSVDSKKSPEEGRVFIAPENHHKISSSIMNNFKLKTFDEKLQKAKEENISDYFKVFC